MSQLSFFRLCHDYIRPEWVRDIKTLVTNLMLEVGGRQMDRHLQMLRDQGESEGFMAEAQHESIAMLNDRAILPKSKRSSTTPGSLRQFQL